MLDSAVRLLAAYADTSSNGLNVVVATLPRVRLDGSSDPLPKPISVFTDLDIGGIDPPKVPAFVFWVDSAADIELKGLHSIAKELIIAAAYVTDEKEDPKRALSDCGLYLRAAEISFKRYNSQANSAGYRELNKIKIHEVRRVTEQRVTAAVGQRKMWGFLYFPVIVADLIT